MGAMWGMADTSYATIWSVNWRVQPVHDFYVFRSGVPGVPQDVWVRPDDGGRFSSLAANKKIVTTQHLNFAHWLEMLSGYEKVTTQVL